MHKLRLLWIVFKRSGAWMAIAIFVGSVLLCGLMVQIAEPEIDSYGDALWFLWAVATTVGLGDYTAVTTVGRVASVICSLFAVVCTSISTAVIVDFFNEERHYQRNEALSEFLDKLEHLPDLSEDELRDISKRVRKLRR